jgi:hypothetical protein
MASQHPNAVRTPEYEDISARLSQVRANLRRVDVHALAPELAQYLADTLNSVTGYLQELAGVHTADTEDDLLPHRRAVVAVHHVMMHGPRDPTHTTSVVHVMSATVWRNCTSLLKAVHRVEEQAYPENRDGWYGPKK